LRRRSKKNQTTDATDHPDRKISVTISAAHTQTGLVAHAAKPRRFLFQASLQPSPKNTIGILGIMRAPML
jgi:hypothetical protein